MKLVCNSQYDEEDLIYLCADKDFSAGWALTKDVFCVGGALKFSCCDMQAEDARYQAELDSQVAFARQFGRKKILYNDIQEIVTADHKREDFYSNEQQEFLNFLPHSGFNFGGEDEYGITFIDHTRQNNPDVFFRENFSGTMMIADNNDIYWNVVPEKKSDKNSSMRIELFRDNKLPDREADIFDIWNDKVEAKVAKFLDFAKN